MEYTELADYPLAAGLLTEWIPTNHDAEHSWNRDPRRLARCHEDHCLQGAAHPSKDWLGTAFEIHEPYDAAVMRETIRIWHLRHEALRTTVVLDDAGGVSRQTLPALGVDVEERPVGLLPTGTAVYDHVIALFESQISPVMWPHLALVTVVPAVELAGRQRFLVIFGADHSVMDAYSLVVAVNELRTLYGDVLSGHADETSRAGSYVDFSHSERALGDAIDADHDVVARWESFLDPVTKEFPAFPLPTRSAGSGHGPAWSQSSLSSWLLSTTQVDQVSDACRASGFSMQQGIVAALGLAARELSGQDTTNFVMPMHTRNEQRYAESIGWFVGISPVQLDLSSVVDFEMAVARAAEATAPAKAVARIPFSRIAELVGCTTAPRFVISYVDIRFIPGAEDFATYRARALRSTCCSDDEVYLWVVRSPRGLNISARFPRDPVSTANFHRFVATFHAVLATVAEHGSHGPATLTPPESEARSA